MRRLQEGDIFRLESGHKVYMELPEHFAYANREGVFGELARTEVFVGTPKGGMPTDWLIGEYVVTATAMTGGGYGHGPHDSYPNGHLVKAEKLLTESFHHRVKVEFYQSGCFTATNPEIEAIGRAHAHWQKEEVRDE